MTVAYLGLGSNLDSPLKQLQRALVSLLFLEQTNIKAVSSFYRSQPWGHVVDQPDFVNAVVCIETAFTPEALLHNLQSIERSHGRVRDGSRWGPRKLDIDILLYGNLVYNSAVLTIPHPYLQDRDFVVHPLLEIAPELVLPDGVSMLTVAESCLSDTLCKLEVETV